MNSMRSAEQTWNRADAYIYGREARRLKIRQIRRKRALRKRIWLILAGFLAAIFLTMVLSGFSRVMVTKAPAYKYYTAVTVRCDDTLWEIAQTHMTEEYSSIRAYIKEIKEINNMKSDSVYYGQKLILPYYSEEWK